MQKSPKSVLLALGWYDHRLMRGIATYAAERGWHIAAASTTQEFAIPYGWKGDGVLTWLAGESDLTDFVLSLKIPTVDFSLRRPHLPFGHVALDHGAAARLAAEHFLSLGFTNFLYYSAGDNWTFEERGKGFVDTFAENDHDCRWIRWQPVAEHLPGESEWTLRQEWLAQKLRQEPKPLAVFTANGTLAVEVLEVCEIAGLQVPIDVAIVGIEDDLLLPQTIQRPITAVDPNLEEQGYQGAALLDRLMNGDPLPEAPIRISPARLLTRHSTDITAVTHAGMLKALQFITKNFDKEIDIDAVARAAGMSRRGLHQAFIDHLGRTPGHHIRTIRLEHAKKLLAETDCKVNEIASLSGYPSVNTFFIAFKQAYSKSPAEYRKEVCRAKN